MDIPLLTTAWRYFTSAAWDSALSAFEMLTLGGHAWWWRLHWAAARQFMFDPPARVAIREAAGTGLPEGQCVYGETPCVSLLAMLRRVDVSPEAVLFDLGCGRGLAMLGAALAFDIRAVGIDAMPTLVQRGRRMARDLDISDRATFIEGDFLQQDLSGGTIFYLASTTFRTEVVRGVAARIASQADRTRPIRALSLSQPLGKPFRVVEQQRYPMTWGWNTVFVQELEPIEEDCAA